RCVERAQQTGPEPAQPESAAATAAGTGALAGGGRRVGGPEAPDVFAQCGGSSAARRYGRSAAGASECGSGGRGGRRGGPVPGGRQIGDQFAAAGQGAAGKPGWGRVRARTTVGGAAARARTKARGRA